LTLLAGRLLLRAPAEQHLAASLLADRERAVVAAAGVLHDEPHEEPGHAVEVALRPRVERVIVALGALELRAEEEARDRDGRLVRRAAELNVERLAARLLCQEEFLHPLV